MEIFMERKVEFENNYRYERKFVIKPNFLNHVKIWLFNNECLFKEIYNSRTINNIYFDTVNFDFYKQNVNGIGSRNKFRLRWYGDLISNSNPTLEIKLKSGIVGNKYTYKMKKILTEEIFNSNFLKKYLTRSELNNNLKIELLKLEPKLVNSYKRIYLQSADKKIRATIDTEIKYFKPNYDYNLKKFKYCKSENSHILELKYSSENDERNHPFFKTIPFRVSKNSKYINGINLTSN